MTLVVTSSCEPETSSNESKYLVEVGFGEPPIHPVLYEFGEEQVTPEGMRSKIVKEGDTVTLCWFKAGEWTERFTWSYEDSIVKKGLALSDFEKGLKLVLADGSIFAEKLIVCRLTRDRKLTLAGNRFKITGPPRFSSDAPVPPPSIRYLDSEEQMREILRDVFGQPWEVTQGLDLSKSNAANPEVWSHV
jgi:arylamine N-acetyltransferase